MASTYSPLLRYELIGAGEQAGIWGNTSNVNLGTLVEQSIAGVTNISATSLGGSTYTLEALNGAPDEARSMVLNFTGGAASSFTVIVPTSQKLYVVRNNTGQTINFKTVSQVTPQPVEDANSTMIFCDGAEVYPGIAAPSVGTLTVSGGGTGATTFTAGFLKSSGGTAALTTASAINLASTDVTNTLSVDKGGTGLSNPTSGRLLLGAGASALTTLAGTSAGNFLSWNGSAWVESAGLGTTKGGTGLTSYTTGQIIYASGTDLLAKLNIGTTGQVLTVSGGVPVWATPAAATGTVTSVSGSGGSTGLSLSGGPITTSGTLTLGGTLDIGSGGTGATSASSARSNLGLGTMATASTSDYVSITGTQTITGRKGFGAANPDASWNTFFQGQSSNPAAVAYAPSAASTCYSAIVNSTGALFAYFAYGTTSSFSAVGNISTNGSSTSYNTSSDYRLKENVRAMAGAISTLKCLSPCTFTWKNNPDLGPVDGFIAHEVQAVVPGAVTGEKDAVNADGSIKPQGLDASKLVPLLTAALQEAVAKIEALEARVAAMGG